MIYPLGTVIFNSYVEEPESATPKKMQKSVSFQDANMCELDDVCVYIYIDIDIDIYIYTSCFAMCQFCSLLLGLGIPAQDVSSISQSAIHHV